MNITFHYSANFNAPKYATNGSAAIDLVLPDELTLTPNEFKLVDLGFKCIMPKGVAALLLPRSGIGAQLGIVLRNTVGLIDSDYHDNIKAMLVNNSSITQTFYAGTRIVQLMFIPYIQATLNSVTDSEFNEQLNTINSDRTGGFGSTGIMTLTSIIPENSTLI